LDYLAAGNEDKLAVFNGFMKTLGSIQSNNMRDSTWFFTEAHKMTKAYLGATGAPAPAAAPPPVNRAVNRAALPPTLARAPMAARRAPPAPPERPVGDPGADSEPRKPGGR
jgi:hypothetical protein